MLGIAKTRQYLANRPRGTPAFRLGIYFFILDEPDQELHPLTKIFEYIELFHNRQRRHSELGISPVEDERLARF